MSPDLVMYRILGVDIRRARPARRYGSRSRMPAQRPGPAPCRASPASPEKILDRRAIVLPGAPTRARNPGYRGGAAPGGSPMNICTPSVVPTPEPIVQLDRLGDEIAELSAHLDAATARLLDLIREFDARGGWSHGFRSCAAWLTWRVGLEPGAAREHVRVARALGSLPRLAHVLACGELSYSKIRALTRVATTETEERLLALGRAGTAEHVERIVRGWRRRHLKAEAQETARRHRGRAVRVYQEEDGMVVIHGRLEPEVGAVLMQALAAARETLYRRARTTRVEDVPAGTSFADSGAEAPTVEQQQADALALVAETALHHGSSAGAPGERYQVVVHLDAEVLEDAETPGHSVLEGGARVPAETSQRLACDASRVVMLPAPDGRVTEIGA